MYSGLNTSWYALPSHELNVVALLAEVGEGRPFGTVTEEVFVIMRPLVSIQPKFILHSDARKYLKVRKGMN